MRRRVTESRGVSRSVETPAPKAESAALASQCQPPQRPRETPGGEELRIRRQSGQVPQSEMWLPGHPPAVFTQNYSSEKCWLETIWGQCTTRSNHPTSLSLPPPREKPIPYSGCAQPILPTLEMHAGILRKDPKIQGVKQHHQVNVEAFSRKGELWGEFVSSSNNVVRVADLFVTCGSKHVWQ